MIRPLPNGLLLTVEQFFLAAAFLSYTYQIIKKHRMAGRQKAPSHSMFTMLAY